jgi:hypothetical protein
VDSREETAILRFHRQDEQDRYGATGSILQRHKYDVRYDTVWRFVAGLLDAKGKAKEFVLQIEAEPHAISGPAHQRLVMHCLSEIGSELSIRQMLEGRLAQWSLFECQIAGFSFSARDSECPERVSVTALRDHLHHKDILWSIFISNKHLSETSVTALVALLHDSESDVRWAAACALEGQTNLPEASITALTAMLGDSEFDVRGAAARALERQINLPEASVTALTALLRDNDDYVRRTAAQALARQANLLQHILSYLGFSLIPLGAVQTGYRCFPA